MSNPGYAKRFKTDPNVRLLKKFGFTDLFDEDAAAKYTPTDYDGKGGLDENGNLFTKAGRYIGRLADGADSSFYKKLLNNKRVQEAASDAGVDKLTKKNVDNIFVNRLMSGQTAKKLAEQAEATDPGLTGFDMDRLLQKDQAKYDRKLQRVRNAGLAEVEKLRGEYNVYSGLTQNFFSG